MGYRDHMEALSQAFAELVHEKCGDSIRLHTDDMVLDFNNVKTPDVTIEITSRQMATIDEDEFLVELVEPAAQYLSVFVKEYGVPFISVPIPTSRGEVSFTGNAQDIVHTRISVDNHTHGPTKLLTGELSLVPIVE